MPEAYSYHDLCTQLDLHGVFTVPPHRDRVARIGPFAKWGSVTPLVRVFLVVPRQALGPLANSTTTPPLHCEFRGNGRQNIFAEVHAFGTLISTGTKRQPQVVLEEDPEGWKGSTSSLVVSFAMPAWLMTQIRPLENMRVCLAITQTFGTVMTFEFQGDLGPDKIIFSAMLLDDSRVYVLPEQPLASGYSRIDGIVSPSPESTSLAESGLATQIGQSGRTTVELDWNWTSSAS